MSEAAGVMKAEMIEADFEKDTLTFRAWGNYYARAGWFYIVPNTVYEDMVEKISQFAALERSKEGE